jgi:hypothetical protein
MKTMLTLSLVGMLLAGAMIGTFVEGTSEPVRQGLRLGVGVWLATFGFIGVYLRLRVESNA